MSGQVRRNWRFCPLCGVQLHRDALHAHVGRPECLRRLALDRGGKLADPERGALVMNALRLLSVALDGPVLREPEQGTEPG